MRTQINKITLFFLLANVLSSGPSYAASSRLDCLDRLGNNATKAALDACVSGSPLQASNANQSSNLDTSAEESSCAEIGFKRKTPAFANCVLELLDRKEERQAVARATDPDDATCRKYGFKPKTTEYASCRLQIDQARQVAIAQNAQFQQQQAQYAEAKRQQSVKANLALMQMGLGMMAGGGGSSSGGGSYGPAPLAPNPTRTYILPNNKMMTCTTAGSTTNCF